MRACLRRNCGDNACCTGNWRDILLNKYKRDVHFPQESFLVESAEIDLNTWFFKKRCVILLYKKCFRDSRGALKNIKEEAVIYEQDKNFDRADIGCCCGHVYGYICVCESYTRIWGQRHGGISVHRKYLWRA